MAKRGQARTKRAWRTPATLTGAPARHKAVQLLPVLRSCPRTPPATITAVVIVLGLHSQPSPFPATAMSSSEPPSYSDDDEAVSQQAQAGLCSTALQSADSSEKGQQKEQGSEEGERPERRMGSQHQQQTDSNSTHTTQAHTPVKTASRPLAPLAPWGP